jgi:hypothetical protein
MDMSVTVKDVGVLGDHCAIRARSGEIEVTVKASSQISVADLSRADRLAAVAAECDVIIIDRAELPEVGEDDGRTVRVGGNSYAHGSREDLRRMALSALVAVTHMDAHSPVDEAQVEALADLFAETFPAEMYRERGLLTERARRLLATGRIEVKP